MLELSGRAIAGIAVGVASVATIGTLITLQQRRSEPEQDAATNEGARWKGSEGSFKDVTHVSGARDASDGAWKLNVNGFDRYSVSGSPTEDGFRAAIDVQRHGVNRTITATSDDAGAISGAVTIHQRELDASGSRIDTTLTKHRFQAQTSATGWSGEILHADGDEKSLISGTTSGNSWKVTIERPDSPYKPHEEFKGKGPISLQEQITLAIAESTT